MSTVISAIINGNHKFGSVNVNSVADTVFANGDKTTGRIETGKLSVNSHNDVTFLLDASVESGAFELGVSNGAAILDASRTSSGVELTSNNADAVLKGGKGDDVLVAGNTGAKLTGGAGADTFEFAGFNSTVTDYTYGDDIFSEFDIDHLAGAGNVAVKGKNVVVKLDGGNTATLVGAAADGIAKVTGNDANDLWVADNEGRLMNAQSVTNNVSLIGGNGADTLQGNKEDNSLFGGEGNDVLWGGVGSNDTMTGGNGANTFWWGAGDGQDTITDFKAGFAAKGNDVLKLYNSNAADVQFGVDGNNFTLTTGSGRDEAVLTANTGNAVGNSVSVLVEDQNGVQQKVYYMVEDTVLTVEKGEEADLYVSVGNGALDFGNTSAGWVDLNESKYKNITGLTGSDTVVSTLVGGATTGSSLTAGEKGAELWGGGGKVDTLVGGNGADTFWFGVGDGKDLAANFAGGFAAGNDTLSLWNVTDMSSLKFGTDGSNSTLVLNKQDVLAFDADLFASDNQAYLKVEMNKDGVERRLWAANNADNVEAALTNSNLADFYLGGTGDDTLNFNAVTGDLYVNLGDATKYANIENVKGSEDGADTLIGGASAGTLTAGNGGAILWGGSEAAHTMIGGEGADEFWFAGIDGKDLAQKYSYDQGDVVHLWDQKYTNGLLPGALITGGTDDVTVQIGSGELTLEGAFVDSAGSATDEVTVTVDDMDYNRVNVVVAKDQGTDSTLTYADDAKLYIASAEGATLKVKEDAVIFLGNGWGVDNGTDTYFTANTIAGIDATDATNAQLVLAGYEGVDNTITGAGAGSTTNMWGGGASSDTLVGGEGKDIFYFGSGDGKDVVQGSSSDDVVKFWTDAIDDLSAQISGNDLVITTKAGDTLTIQNFDNNSFEANGVAYSYDDTTNSFQKK